jgi:hypothetical protein
MAPDPGPGSDGREPPAWRQVETLGVADVVVCILQARKERPWASAAGVWRQHRGGTVYVRVILLESAPAPSSSAASFSAASPDAGAAGQDERSEVIGEFAARRLGADLVTAFGAKDVIVLS